MKKHLLCIDGTNFLRTCYEANPTPESSDKVDGALKSAIGACRNAIKFHQPTHVLVALDIPNSRNWRHDLYADYKKSRKPTPALLAERVPEFGGRLKELGIAAVSCEGHEADDVINSGCKTWINANVSDMITVSSSDKDLTQLVAEGVIAHMPFRGGEWRGPEWIMKEYGVEPHFLLDSFSMIGDTTDDIPGVTKVGPKNAAGLLNEYGSLEAILQAAAEGKIKGKLGENLVKDAENARISKKLVSLSEPPLGLSMKDLRVDWTRF